MKNSILYKLLASLLVVGIILVSYKFRLGGVVYLYLLAALYVGYGMFVVVHIFKSKYKSSNALFYLSAFVSASSLSLFVISLIYLSSLYIFVTFVMMLILNTMFIIIAKLRYYK